MTTTTSSPSPFPSPDDLSLLSEVLREVARRRLPPDDAEDFVQAAHVRLLERNYEVFRRFDGRSSLRTYLTVVVVRLLLDWRNSTYGKWRPSAAAVRLGPDAVRLERLIHRDGYATEEAIAIVRQSPDAPPGEVLRDLRQQLPPRLPRRRVPDSMLETIAAGAGVDPAIASENRRRREAVSRMLAGALRALPDEERELIVERFLGNRTIQAIARRRREQPGTLYRRLHRVLLSLRRTLTAAGALPPSVTES